MGEGSNISLPGLVPAVSNRAIVEDRLRNTTFVGIDFGTSTTVATCAVLDDATIPVRTQPVQMWQNLPDGRTCRHHLVPTAVAWFENRLLVGIGAAQVQSRLRQGVDVWTSFKMALGTDLGYQYYNTSLHNGHPVAMIRTPREAASVFLTFMREGIERFVQEEKLPGDIRYAVSIPASFEANQREDLLAALQSAGIKTDGPTFIDEPNAAFLSYLTEANSNGLGRYSVPRDDSLHVLIFDFGAGTCDISILEIGQQPTGAFCSKNLAISRFEALGGDDIDRAVVYRVLLPELLCENGILIEDLSSADISKRVVPSLMRAAEQLKITLCKRVATEAMGARLPALARSTATVALTGTTTIQLPKRALSLTRPAMSYESFQQVMTPFLAPPGTPQSAVQESVPPPVSVLDPVKSALSKASLRPDEIDMVLLIGGSAENPYVQAALQDYFGRTDIEVPVDLRTHVSTGAAVHALLLHGLGVQTIRPITSEPILAVTRNGTVKTLIPAGTEIPCPAVEVADLVVPEEGQGRIQIPISVSTPSKVLTVVEIEAHSPAGFDKGTSVRLRCDLSPDKALRITATVSERETAAASINPFANRELTPQDRMVLNAERDANNAATQNGGRPTPETLLKLSRALEEAGSYTRAAETLETVQIMNPRADYSTKLYYLYNWAERSGRGAQWAETAYERQQTAITAFNLGLAKLEQGDRDAFVRLMEEALKHDPCANFARVIYGRHLARRGEGRGESLLKAAVESLDGRRNNGMASPPELRLLAIAAEELGMTDLSFKSRLEASEQDEKPGVFDEGKLLAQNLDFPVTLPT